MYICHLFIYWRKRSPRDCVIKLRDNQIFKVLIKKSFKFIDFDLAKTRISLQRKSPL